VRCFALACLGALLLADAVSAERVRSWDTEIYLESQDAFGVIERIRWDFEGESRHGILRHIPVAYGRGRAADYHIRVDVSDVTDADGRSHQWRARRKGPNLEIRIGDPDRTVSGAVDYWIHYRVRRGILFLEEHDELYWNATGTEVDVPIDATSATVYLPGALTPDDVRQLCFTGSQGSIEQACDVRPGENAVRFESTRRLRAHEGLSVVLGVPKGAIAEPTAFERMLDRVRDHLSGWLVLPLAVLGALAALWRRQGRDPVVGAAIAVRYEPPEGISPAEVGTVLDERADLIDVTATILDLAVRGYLRIEELDVERFLFLRTKDWRLVRLREPDDLRAHEALLFARLFKGREEVRISELKNQFYRDLPAIRDAIYRAVSAEDRFFPVSPAKVRNGWAIGAAAIGVLGFVLVAGGGAPAGGVALLASGALVFAFSRWMPRRTRRGRKAYEEILGFQEFVTRVDKDRLERFGGRTAERFERVLPYALVLGAADAWADAFGDLYTQPPPWYVGHSGPFHTRLFVDELGSSLHAMGQAMASTPRPSGGSGSSGFGGGGASSW